MGSGAMTNSMDDISQEAEAFFIIGSNTSEQHPVFGTMLRRAVRFRGAKLIVADPRRIDIVDFATLHLRHRTCLRRAADRSAPQANKTFWTPMVMAS